MSGLSFEDVFPPRKKAADEASSKKAAEDRPGKSKSQSWTSSAARPPADADSYLPPSGDLQGLGGGSSPERQSLMRQRHVICCAHRVGFYCLCV